MRASEVHVFKRPEKCEAFVPGKPRTPHLWYHSVMHPSRRVLIFVLIFFLALFFRLYRFSDLTWFWGDQAIDLMVARRALVDGVWPLVGPYLSVEKFSVPPTYYWLLTFFLWIGKTPESAAFFFVMLDVVTMVLLYRLARALTDHWGGLITLLLYAASFVGVQHARSMWQPHPVQAFLVGALYLLHRAWIAKRALSLWGCVVLYALAASMYPSPVLLFPFFFVHALRWHRVTGSTSWIRAIARSAVMVGIVFFVVWFPQLVYEWRNSFPTYHAIRSSSFGFPSTGIALEDLSMNVFGLFLSFSALAVVHRLNYVLYVLAFIAGFGIVLLPLVFRTKSVKPMYREALSFFQLPWLGVGFFGIVFFRAMFNYDWSWHRLHAFLPFVMLLFGMTIRYAFSLRRLWYIGIVSTLFALYLFGNGLTFFWWFARSSDVAQMAHAREIAVYINGSAQVYQLANSDFSFLSYVPEDYWNYTATTELFFLGELRGYPVRFTKTGNDIDRAFNDPPQPYVFLACKEFWQIEDIYGMCLRKFFERFPNYTVTAQKLFPLNTVVFTLKKRDV